MIPARLWGVTVLGFLLAMPAGAFANAFLKHAAPPAGGEVAVSPPALTLVFTEAVEPRFSTIGVQDKAGASVPTGKIRPKDNAMTLTVTLPKLAPGTYTVIWHVTSVDTHRTEGRYVFTVLP
jgi:copper resistance protein C